MKRDILRKRLSKINTKAKSRPLKTTTSGGQYTPCFEDSTSHFSSFYGVTQRRESTYISVSRHVDKRKDTFRSNADGPPTFCDRLFATGFDPYIVTTVFPSEETFSTTPVYNVKRACKFRKKDNNQFVFNIPCTTEWKKICIRFVLFDSELIWDKQVGGVFLWLNDVIDDVGDKKVEELVLRRHGNYCGSLEVAIDFQRLDKGVQDMTLKITVLAATHLKKDYDPEISVFYSARVAISSIIGFIIYLCIVAAIFYEVEKGANPNLHGFGDAFWFTFITATTVGFGDIVPVTDTGLYLNCIFILLDFMFIGYLVTLSFDFVAASFEKTGRDLNRYGGVNEFDIPKAKDFMRVKLGVEDGTLLDTKKK